MSIQEDKAAILKNNIQLIGYRHIFGMVNMNGTILDKVPEFKFDAEGQAEYDLESAKAIKVMTTRIEGSFGKTLSHERAEELAYSFQRTYLEISVLKNKELHENLLVMKDEDEETLYDYIVHDLPVEKIRKLGTAEPLTLIEFVNQAETNGFTQDQAHQAAIALLNAPLF